VSRPLGNQRPVVRSTSLSVTRIPTSYQCSTKNQPPTATFDRSTRASVLPSGVHVCCGQWHGVVQAQNVWCGKPSTRSPSVPVNGKIPGLGRYGPGGRAVLHPGNKIIIRKINQPTMRRWQRPTTVCSPQMYNQTPSAAKIRP